MPAVVQGAADRRGRAEPAGDVGDRSGGVESRIVDLEVFGELRKVDGLVDVRPQFVQRDRPVPSVAVVETPFTDMPPDAVEGVGVVLAGLVEPPPSSGSFHAGTGRVARAFEVGAEVDELAEV